MLCIVKPSEFYKFYFELGNHAMLRFFLRLECCFLIEFMVRFFALFLFFVSGFSYAQDAFSPYKLKGFPVQFSYPSAPVAFPVKEVGKYTYVLSDNQSEFYVKFTRVGQRFTSDSLKAMFLKLYSDDPNIKNLQVRELASGEMGGHKADKAVLSFVGRDKMYLITAFMVRFYINERYNSVLFYFEMGERNAPSYAMLQEKMIESLKYTEISYNIFESQAKGLKFPIPDYWKVTDADTVKWGDGRGFFTLSYIDTNDSIPLNKSVDALKDKMKANGVTYPNNKFKVSHEKSGDFVYSKISGTYDYVNPFQIKRRDFLQIIIFRKKYNDKIKEYRISMECPEFYLKFYEPIWEKFSKEIEISGSKFLFTN
jgi:hypothetical protein